LLNKKASIVTKVLNLTSLLFFSYVNFFHPAAEWQKSPKAPPGIPLPGCPPQG
jgi:hypothetical protein